MATRRVSAASVVSYFCGGEDSLPEVFYEGSDDDLGFEESEDELSTDEEPAENKQLVPEEHPVEDGVYTTQYSHLQQRNRKQ